MASLETPLFSSIVNYMLKLVMGLVTFVTSETANSRLNLVHFSFKEKILSNGVD